VLLGAVVALGAAALPVTAQQSVLFAGVGVFTANLPPSYGLTPGAFSFNFLLPQSPTPSAFNPILFNFAEATGTFIQGGIATTQTGRLTFFTAADGGGFSFRPAVVGITLINTTGPAPFTGPTSAPTFTPGTYTGFATDIVAGSGFAIITSASISVVPEPGSLVLLGTGVVGLGVVARHRRRT